MGTMLPSVCTMAEPVNTELFEAEVAVASADYDASSIAGFVDRLYEIALGREADEQGKENWINALVDDKVDTDAARVAWGFIGSTEYSQKNRSNEDYLEDLYKIFWDRDSDVGGEQSWLNVMDTGISRKYIANKFAKSAEFSQICQQYGVERGNIPLTELRDLHQQVAVMVTAHYRSCLGRSPSAKEINGWISEVVDGYESVLVYGVFHFGEFISRNISYTEFVEALYHALLMRNPDDGCQGWVEKLEQGVSRDSVIEGFLESGEFQDICESAGIMAKKKTTHSPRRSLF